MYVASAAEPRKVDVVKVVAAEGVSEVAALARAAQSLAEKGGDPCHQVGHGQDDVGKRSIALENGSA